MNLKLISQLRISDADEAFKLIPKNNAYAVVYPNEGVRYWINRRGANWACTCTGFKYRGTCKHVKALQEQSQTEPKHGAEARLAQVEKSYNVWKKRYEDSPTAANKKMYDLRAQQLEEAKQKVEEEKKNPKVRKPRAVAEAFMPEVEEIFKGFSKWSVVGSFLRNAPTFKDIDVIVVATPTQFETIYQRLSADPNYKEINHGPDIIRGYYHGEMFDVSRVPDESEWGGYLMYRTGCFTADTKVVTPKGLIPIKDLVVGDTVFAGDGTLTRVVDKFKYLVNRTCEFNSRSAHVECTPEHKVLTPGNGTGGALYPAPKWIEAQKLGRYSQLFYPYLKVPEVVTDLTRGEAFLAGLYLSDGNLNARRSTGLKKSHQSKGYLTKITDGWFSYNLRISANTDSIQGYLKMFEKYSIPIHRHSGGRGKEYTYIIKNKRLQEVCLKYSNVTIKELGYTKKVSEEVLTWPPELKKEFLRGFFLGDGTLGRAKFCSIIFLNTNEQVVTMLWLLAKQFYSCTGVKMMYEGIGNRRAMYQFSIVGADAERCYNEILTDIVPLKGVDPLGWSKDPVHQCTFNGNIGVSKILRRGEVKKFNSHIVDVYDIQVESETSSFLIEDGFTVHNSKDFNIAMRGILKKYGWSLNEHGLFDDKGNLVASKSEEDIFKALNMPYVPPQEREKGRYEKYLRMLKVPTD